MQDLQSGFGQSHRKGRNKHLVESWWLTPVHRHSIVTWANWVFRAVAVSPSLNVSVMTARSRYCSTECTLQKPSITSRRNRVTIRKIGRLNKQTLQTSSHFKLCLLFFLTVGIRRQNSKYFSFTFFPLGFQKPYNQNLCFNYHKLIGLK